MPKRLLAAALLAGLALLSVSCRQQEAPSAESIEAAAKAQREAKAEQAYVLYEQMLQADNAELALPLGDEILAMYPDTSAAARVREGIEALRSKASTEGEARRLSRLWTYQTSPMAGGTQSTASINNQPQTGTAGASVRLVFRRHTEWGQSVFLYGEEPGFTCAANCRVKMTFDDKPATTMEGSIPPTGEPAIFIEEDRKFIAAVGQATKVAIEVNPKGQSARTLVFEVGGFDADKFLPLPK
jgi:hypothetical protein